MHARRIACALTDSRRPKVRLPTLRPRPPLRSMPLWPGAGTSHNRLTRRRRGPPPQRTREDRSMPADRRLIVDAQVHLWKAESPDWQWVPGLKPQLPEPFTVERLVPMMDEAGVDRAVIVPPSWPGDRNDYAIEAVKRYPDRFRIMGKLPIQDPKALDLLPKWKEQQGMLGVRVIFNTPQNIPWLTDGTADRFWAAAEKANLPVMCFAPGRTAALGPVAERHPQLQLILDHMGATAAMVRDNTLDAAIGQTVALAKYPNVSVKVSASPGLSRQPYPFRDVV